MKQLLKKILGQPGAQTSVLRHIETAKKLKGKRVIVRCDFNVPLGDDNKVDPEESWRIQKALKTIEFLHGAGARIILISHIGRDPEMSLRPVADFFNHELDMTVGFIPEVTGQRASEASERLGEGQIIMLENLRSDPREKANNQALAEELATMADIYVNEAFSNAHREHASMVGLPKLLPSYIGFQFNDEVQNLTSAIDPEKPVVVIVGGAKFETKLPLIQSMLPTADTLFIGGALAHTFFKAQGYEIGQSMFEELAQAGDILKNENVMTPVDVIAEGDNKSSRVSAVDSVKATERIVDLGPESLNMLAEKISDAATVVWNGPLGWYEGGYEGATKDLLEIIAKSSARSIIGGGDTVFVIRKNNMEDNFTFVSTAGGAMLDFLVNGGSLPAITALRGV